MQGAGFGLLGAGFGLLGAGFGLLVRLQLRGYGLLVRELRVTCFRYQVLQVVTRFCCCCMLLLYAVIGLGVCRFCGGVCCCFYFFVYG